MYRALLLFQNFVTVFNNLRNADSDDALETVWEIWLKIIECAAIIMIGLALSTLIRYLIRKAFRLPSRGGGKSETLSSLLQNFVKYGFWFFIVCQLLTTFGVAVESVLAVAGIGSVAIGFGAQTVVKDVITGMFILLENQYNIGDIITVNGLTGEIESLGVRTTKIRNINGNLHILPNSAIVAVTNMSRHYRRPTLNLDFPNAKPVDYI
ncbi:MAG: mechanosensitive ion channel family protein, partial [Clostridiales bacterium]|nr:mechanosensitive ion channel family protein [Clostridiales bacterium]